MELLSEDRALLDGFREGRSAALDRVYRHYAPRLARILSYGFTFTSGGAPMSAVRLSSPFELESAVQEVFVRAFAPRARLAYDGVRPYIDFLVGIGKHVVLDDLRRRGHREAPVDDAQLAALAPADDAAPPEETIEERRAREVVQAFLEKDCDDRDRQLYALRFVDEMTQEGTAAAAGLTRIQVRRWETKFRARLLRHLKRVKYVR